ARPHGAPGTERTVVGAGEPGNVGDRRRDRHAGAAALLRDEERGLDPRAPPGCRFQRQPRAPRHAPVRPDVRRPPVSDTRIRIYLLGSCDGFQPLRDQLAAHPELELVGESEHVGQAAAVLAGGHLDCVLLATRGSALPAAEIAALREHTRAPLVMIASGEAGAILEQALDADVSDVLLLPQLTHNVVFAIRKAAHVRRQTQAATGRTCRVMTVFSPKGGTGKTTVATNLAAALCKREGRRTLLLDLDLQFGDAAIVLGLEPEKTIYDLVTAPGEL